MTTTSSNNSPGSPPGSHDGLARFPQLLVAPALLAIIWNSLFGRFAPLDIRELMHAHLDLIFGERNAT